MSINQRKLLPGMASIGGGDSITRRKVNFRGCTWTIHPTRIMNGLKKNRVIYKPTKRPGPREQEMVKTQLKIVEVEISHSVLIDAVFIVHWLWNIPVWHNKNYWTLQPVKLEGQDEDIPSNELKLSILSFYSTFGPLPHDPKSIRISKIYISTIKSSPSEEN